MFNIMFEVEHLWYIYVFDVAGCELSEEGRDSLWESIWCGSSWYNHCLCKKMTPLISLLVILKGNLHWHKENWSIFRKITLTCVYVAHISSLPSWWDSRTIAFSMKAWKRFQPCWKKNTCSSFQTNSHMAQTTWLSQKVPLSPLRKSAPLRKSVVFICIVYPTGSSCSLLS